MKSFFVKQRVANSKIEGLSIISKIILFSVLLLTFISPIYCLTVNGQGATANNPLESGIFSTDPIEIERQQIIGWFVKRSYDINTRTSSYSDKTLENLRKASIGDLRTLKINAEARDKQSAIDAANAKAIAAEDAKCDWFCRAIKAASSFLANEIIGFPIRYILIPVAKILMAIAGKILDFSIHYTIFSGQMQEFDKVVKEVWMIIRDVFNISFIFILLYIAIKKIVGAASIKTKEMLISIIISALLINFSFFISRVVIDAGNKVAEAFLNQMQGDSTEQSPSIQEGVASFITESIAGLDSKEIKLSSILANNIGIGSIDKTLSTANQSERTGLVGLIITLILVLVVTYVFFFLAFLIIGRFVMLIFLVAVSPIGFVGSSVPDMKKYADEWRHELINQTILAPVFMFFMLLITKIASVTTEASGDATGLRYFKFLLIIFFLFKAVGKSKELSGKIGGFADKAASFATGAALAVATGGTALIARQTLGRGAAALAETKAGKWLENKAAKGGIGGRLANIPSWTLKKGASSSYDTRNTAVGKKALGFVKSEGGIDLAGDYAKSGGVGYGKDKKGSGFTGWKDARNKNYEETMMKQADKESGFESAEKKAKELKSIKENIDAQAQQRSKTSLSTENSAVKTSKDALVESNKELKTAEQELLKIEEKERNTSKDPMSIDRMIVNSELNKAKAKVEELKKSNETAKTTAKTSENNLKNAMETLKATIAKEMGLVGKDGSDYNIGEELEKADKKVLEAIDAKNKFISDIANKKSIFGRQKGQIFSDSSNLVSSKTREDLVRKLRAQKGSYKPGPDKDDALKVIKKAMGIEDEETPKPPKTPEA